MAKTQQTIDLEKELYKATADRGVFGCFEVTIGWYGKERVDYITMDTKEIFRCYEIKVSKADFYSKASKTFIGDFNYFVMPDELYEQVKHDIPNHIGVHNGKWCIKKAKKQEVDSKTRSMLKSYMLRSLSRYFNEIIDNDNESLVKQLKRRNNQLESENKKYYNKYCRYSNFLFSKFGDNFEDIVEEELKNGWKRKR